MTPELIKRGKFLKNRTRTELILKQVEEWKQKNEGLASVDLTLSFVRAILAVRKRALYTLSKVTVSAVIDRALFESKEKYPALREITNGPEGLNFEKFENQIFDSGADVRQEALQEFLIELLEVFGKITANILTKYLIQELMTIVHEPNKLHSDTQSVRKLSSVKNRDKNEN